MTCKVGTSNVEVISYENGEYEKNIHTMTKGYKCIPYIFNEATFGIRSLKIILLYIYIEIHNTHTYLLLLILKLRSS